MILILQEERNYRTTMWFYVHEKWKRKYCNDRKTGGTSDQMAFGSFLVNLGSAKKSAHAITQGSVLEESSHSRLSHPAVDKEWLPLNISQNEEILAVSWNSFHMFWRLHKHTGAGQVWWNCNVPSTNNKQEMVILAESVHFLDFACTGFG